MSARGDRRSRKQRQSPCGQDCAPPQVRRVRHPEEQHRPGEEANSSLPQNRTERADSLLPVRARGRQYVVAVIDGLFDAVERRDIRQMLEAARGWIVAEQLERRMLENMPRNGVVR